MADQKTLDSGDREEPQSVSSLVSVIFILLVIEFFLGSMEKIRIILISLLNLNIKWINWLKFIL